MAVQISIKPAVLSQQGVLGGAIDPSQATGYRGTPLEGRKEGGVVSSVLKKNLSIPIYLSSVRGVWS